MPRAETGSDLRKRTDMPRLSGPEGNLFFFDRTVHFSNTLNKKYDVYIVTSYLWRDVIDISGKNLGYKYYYLKEKLPFIDPSKYIFTTNKNLLKFDIKLDDKIGNLEGAETKILFNSWHNNHETYSDDIIRVNNWKEIGDVLL